MIKMTDLPESYKIMRFNDAPALAKVGIRLAAALLEEAAQRVETDVDSAVRRIRGAEKELSYVKKLLK